MFLEPDKYLENILGIENIRNKDKLMKMHKKAVKIKTWDELIEVSKKELSNIIKAKMKELAKREKLSLKREDVEGVLKTNSFIIDRIMNIPGMDRQEVAEEISKLLSEHGDGFVNVMSPNEVIRAEERFYVLTVFNSRLRKHEILGCIAVRMRDGEISHLVVNKKFRSLGIAKALVRYVLNLNLNSYWAYVRKNNVASLGLFRSFGFNVVSETDKSFELRLEVVEKCVA
jgi:ribosomal protein S18 acetylase RimI-like enzyme